jgi:transcriptional regulator with XRE-family HTH domain
MPANHRRTSDFGRRLRGLSQLELALRVGSTPRHISFLETGRSRSGNEMVIRLASELDVPPREQNALLEAAGLPATYSHHPLEASEIARLSAVIDSRLRGHEPLPAAVIDRYGTVRVDDRKRPRQADRDVPRRSLAGMADGTQHAVLMGRRQGLHS